MLSQSFRYIWEWCCNWSWCFCVWNWGWSSTHHFWSQFWLECPVWLKLHSLAYSTLNSWKRIRLRSWAQTTDHHIWLGRTLASWGKGESEAGSLHKPWNTVQDENVLQFAFGNELNNGPPVSENPTHRTIWHFFQKPIFKLLNSRHQLWRHVVFAAFRVVDLPTARSEHHDVHAKTKFIF